MNFFRSDQPFTEAAARNCFIANQFATPGLGSLMAGRWRSGIGQLVLAIIGFVLVMVWFALTLIAEFSLMDGSGEPVTHGWVGISGAAIFGIAWLWALGTSIQLMRLARTHGRAASLKPPRYPDPPEK